MKISTTLFWLVWLLFIVTGCENPQQETVNETNRKPPNRTSSTRSIDIEKPLEPLVQASAVVLLEEPVETSLVETTAEALPIWRKHSIGKPILLMLGQDPILQNIPDDAMTQAQELTRTGDIDDFRQQALPTAPAPVMLPNMALSAALDAGFFSGVTWVLPVASGTEVSLDSFLDKMLESGDITQDDADTFQAQESSFVGTIRGVPFTVVLKSAIPRIDTPVVLHLDIGFLAADYQHEIRTPLYQHAGKLLEILKNSQLKVLSVTICQSNIEGTISLKTRFLGDYLRRLFTHPAGLRQPLTGNDALRNEALYLGNFFKKEDVLSLCRQMVDNAPQDASAHYDLYQSLRQFNHIDEAFAHLDQSIRFDPVYGMEYLALADVAMGKNRLDGALKMLEKAAEIFPDNPFTKIGLADLLIRTGEQDKALEILKALKQLPWSSTYHSHVPQYLDEMIAVAEAP